MACWARKGIEEGGFGRQEAFFHQRGRRGSGPLSMAVDGAVGAGEKVGPEASTPEGMLRR